MLADATEAAVERSSQLSRLGDSTNMLFQQYSELLRCSQVGGDVDQQVKQFRSAVLASGLVQSAQVLQQLEDELRRGAVLAEHARVADEIASVAGAHDAAASEGQKRLRRTVNEMQAGLQKLEENYYGCSVQRD